MPFAVELSLLVFQSLLAPDQAIIYNTTNLYKMRIHNSNKLLIIIVLIQVCIYPSVRDNAEQPTIIIINKYSILKHFKAR